MSETAHETGGAGPSHRSVEAAVAIVAGILGLITVIGSYKVGAGWGDEGPKAGFFPFYIGLIIVISSAINLFHVLAAGKSDAVFATWDQIYKVLTVVVPTAIYVTMIPFTGIYVASALLIGLFMIWLGKYRAVIAIPVAIFVPIFFFITFERWFLVPLPKGPIETLLGF
jgi:putative tricarboxylic transport membrane protein